VKLLLAFLVALGGAAHAQEAKKKPAVKQKAHSKATPEQIRKFRQLEEKQKK
jgi:hypothetical protein